MQPFLLLGDITGALVIFGLAVLVFGGLVCFIGIRLLQMSVSTIGSRVIASLSLALGALVVLVALVFLVDVLDAQPFRALRRQVEEAEVARQDTILRTQKRQAQLELKQFEQSFDQPRQSLPDSSQRYWVRHDSITPLRDEEDLSKLKW